MTTFTQLNAHSVAEACELLKELGSQVRPYGGGTDLLTVLRDNLLPEPPGTLVNLKSIPGLDGIREDESGLRVGALATLNDIARSPLVAARLPLLAKAALSVGSTQLRNVGTLGGNLCQEVRCWYYRYPAILGGAIPCRRKGGQGCPAAGGDNRYHAVLGAKGCFAASPSDLATALAALDATLEVAGSGGARTIPALTLHTPLGLSLAPDEIVTGARIPFPPEGARQSFVKFTLRKPIDFAVVSAGAVVTEEGERCAEARIALGAVAPTPLRARVAEEFLTGKAPNAENVSRAADLALEGAKPLRMNGYKVEISKALVRRALSGTQHAGSGGWSPGRWEALPEGAGVHAWWDSHQCAHSGREGGE